MCKSHSVENMNRGHYGACLKSGTGTSGTTYKSLLNYIRVHKPKRILLENVLGICFRARAKGGGWLRPQIRTVLSDMAKLGLAVGYVRTSSHFFLQPVCRNRFYIAGENVQDGKGNFDSQLFVRSLRSM